MKRHKTILITGAAGFIGSHLSEFYIRNGCRVIGVDNLITGALENLSGLKNEPRFSLIRKDIAKEIKVPGACGLILNFASPASPPDYLRLPLETLSVGSFGVFRMLELARTKKAVFLTASTSEVYGDPEISPQHEQYWGHVNPVGVRSVYDEAKRFSEALTMAYYREKRVDTKIIRIFNTYGKRMRIEDGRVIPNFLSQAIQGKPLTVYGNGNQTRSYCYVDDLVDGIDRMAHSRLHEPVNLGNPNERTVLSLAKLIIKMTGSKSPIVYRQLPSDDPKRRCPDIRRAQKELGWTPKVTLEAGLTQTIEYFRAKISRSRS